MILLPLDTRFALRANDINRCAAASADKPEPDPMPVLELFNPRGAATWLATELDQNGDTLFGLADLGFAKLARPEITSTMQTYLDLHRHAAVRTALLLGHPGVALRLMVAHAIGKSHLWRVSPEPQTNRNDEVRESLETCRAETVFDERRRAVLAVLDFSPEEPTVIGGSGDDYAAAGISLRLIDLPNPVVMEAITVIMGETLASGSAAVAAVGLAVDVDMADWWQADPAFFALIRDKEVLSRIVAEVAGEPVATANAGEKTKTLKRIVSDHLDGADGRTKVERWVPSWMRFPASVYTTHGGVGTVAAHARSKRHGPRNRIRHRAGAVQAGGAQDPRDGTRPVQFVEGFSNERQNAWCIHCGALIATSRAIATTFRPSHCSQRALRERGADYDDGADDEYGYLPQVIVCRS